MSDTLEVVLRGMTPVGQGRMTGYPIRGKGGKLHVQMVHSNAATLKPWRSAVAAAAREAAKLQDWDTSRDADPLMLDGAVFLFPRPANHYRTGRFSHLLRDVAPRYPTGQQYGDVDHLVRAVLDALTESRVIADDKLVVRLREVQQVFADPEPPGVELTLRRL